MLLLPHNHYAQLLIALTTSAYYSPEERTMSSYNYLSFQRKVQAALESVERVLQLERKPRLADDVDHTYGAKYGLVNLTSNVAIIAFMNCLERLGLDTEVLKSIDKTKPATLEFESSTSPIFLKKVTVDVSFLLIMMIIPLLNGCLIGWVDYELSCTTRC